MALAFLAVLLLCVPCAAVALEAPPAPRLIFTEYMEAGDGINRAIEIANVGDATASFATSPHTLAVYSGGGALSSEIPIDAGSLAPGEVLVVTHPDAVDLLAQPKLHTSHILASRSLLFDGDDAIALEDTARTPLDMIGTRSSSMHRFLSDITLRRSTHASTPQGHPGIADTPWVAFTGDSFDGFGCTGVSTCAQSRLVFSEYLEGGGSNRAVEIANVGDGMHLFTTSPMKVVVYRAGEGPKSEVVLAMGRLPAGAVMVVAHPGALGLLMSLAKPQLRGLRVQTSSAMDFDGGDAVGLVDVATGSTRDLIGCRPMPGPILSGTAIRRGGGGAQSPLGFPDLGGTAWVQAPGGDVSGFGCRGTAGCPLPRLVFTECVEGSGFNKAVEIANVGDAPHAFQLLPVNVTIFRSGGAADRQIALTAGRLLPQEVVVVYHTDASVSLSQTNSVPSDLLDFNGNDAIGIVDRTTGSVLDLLGSRPMHAGLLKGKTIRRATGSTAAMPEGFDSLEGVPWEVFGVDVMDGLGCIGPAACVPPQ